MCRVPSVVLYPQSLPEQSLHLRALRVLLTLESGFASSPYVPVSIQVGRVYLCSPHNFQTISPSFSVSPPDIFKCIMSAFTLLTLVCRCLLARLH